MKWFAGGVMRPPSKFETLVVMSFLFGLVTFATRGSNFSYWVPVTTGLGFSVTVFLVVKQFRKEGRDLWVAERKARFRSEQIAEWRAEDRSSKRM